MSDALAGAARFGAGALSDEPERRRTLAVGGYTATAVLSAAIAPVTATWQVAVLRAGAWTARGLRVPARNALLADVVPAAVYGRAYGFERAMDNIGAILGPLAAIGLVATLGTRWAIGLSVIPGLLAALAIVYAIRHTPRPTPQPKRQLKFHIRPVLTGKLRPLFAGIGAFELGNCAATLLILRATELLQPEHGKDRATTIALTLYVSYNIAATITSVIAGRFSDRNGPTRVLLAGIVAFGIAYLGFSHDTPKLDGSASLVHPGRHRYRLRRDSGACRGRDALANRDPRIHIWSTGRDAEFRQLSGKPGRRNPVDHPQSDWYAGVEHFGGHEMAEVVKSERCQPGRPAMPEKGFRHPVRLPRCGAVVVAEDERLSGRTARGGRPVGEQLAGLFVEIDDVSAFRLRRREDGPSGPSTQTAQNEIRRAARLMLRHRNPSNCARRAPVTAASVKNSSSCRSRTATNSSSDFSSAGVGGRISFVGTTIRCARDAGLSQTHPHRIACENAELITTWILATVAAANAAPFDQHRTFR